MTKTEAARRTRAQLRYGYFRDNATAVHVTCPECRQNVRAAHLPWEEPTPALRTALITHFIDKH